VVMIETWVLPLMDLSSGPTTPEAVGFSKLEPGEDVNLYKGDFSYTVPLFSMGGIHLILLIVATMEQEASWVGLGWNLDVGAIDRRVRGLPDNFRGDKVVQEDNIRPDITATFGVGLALELIGKEKETGKIRLFGKKKKGEQKKEGAILTLVLNNYRGLIWGVGFNIRCACVAGADKEHELWSTDEHGCFVGVLWAQVIAPFRTLSSL